MLISQLAELNQISKDTGEQVFAGTEAMPAIAFPPVVTAQWEEQVLSIAILILGLIFLVYIIIQQSKSASLTNELFWLFQLRRLYLLLTVKESAIEVPTNSEVRRRIAFFTNSLFMDMPRAPRVRKMLSFRFSTVP
jgi:callose synthase